MVISSRHIINGLRPAVSGPARNIYDGSGRWPKYPGRFCLAGDRYGGLFNKTRAARYEVLCYPTARLWLVDIRFARRTRILPRRLDSAEQKSLRFIAAHLPDGLKLGFRLDTFGDDPQVQAVSE